MKAGALKSQRVRSGEKMQYLTEYESPIGMFTIASDGENITGLWMAGQKYFGSTLDDKREQRNLPVFDQARNWLDQYFTGKVPPMTLSLAPAGSEFRQSVWQILLEIPYGQLTTYGAIAKKMAARTGRESVSAQAVGGAVGHNPVSVIIPCHRVVGSNGSLTGYAGGLGKKNWLLNLEQADMAGLYAPARGTAM